MKQQLRLVKNALLFLLGFIILPHLYASYFVSVISHGADNPIQQYIDVGNKLYIVAYLIYAFQSRDIRELKYFNFLFFCMIYAAIMFFYLKFAL